VLALCFLLNMFGRGMADTYTVFLLPLEREFGWTRSQVTGVYSVYLLVNGFTAPFVGMLFDRVGPRWVYGAGIGLLGAAFFLAQDITSLWQFYLFIGVMVGLAVSFNGMVPASALLARWYRERLSTAIGIAFSAVGVGTVIFVPLAQQVVLHFDWRTVYRGFGIALLLLAPLVLFALPWRRIAGGQSEPHSATRPTGPKEGWTVRSAMGTGIYWGMAQTFFCTAVGMFSIVVQLVAFLIDAGYSPLAAATTFGIMGLLSSISIMGSGFVADRFGYRRTVTASFVASGTGVLILMSITAWPSPVLLALFLPVFGLAMGSRGPIISSICARHFAGPRVATIFGTIYSCNALGAAFGSLVGGVLHDLTGGYLAGLGFSLTFIVLAALPMWLVPALRNYR
jgi:MFS family permease